MESSNESLKSAHNHSFILTTYTSFTYCDVCSKLLWGVAKQGYTCAKCGINVHEACINDSSECVPNSDNKVHTSFSSPLGSKNALNLLSLGLTATPSNIIKSMSEATQKIHGTKSLVKDKIHKLNSSSELNNLISNNNLELSNNDIHKNETENKEKSTESLNSINSKSSNNSVNNDTTGKLVLLSETSDDEYNSNSSEIKNKTHKKKKFVKKKVSSDVKGNSEIVIKNSNIDLKSNNTSNEDVNNDNVFNEQGNITNPDSSKLIRRKNHKNLNNDKDDESQQNYNEENSIKSKESKDSGKYIKDSDKDSELLSDNDNNDNKNNHTSQNKKSKHEGNVLPESVVNNAEEKLNDTENNDETLIQDSYSTISSISNFKASDLTEIIREPHNHSTIIENSKLSLKSKPSQSEICSVVVTSAISNNLPSVESNLTEMKTSNNNSNNDVSEKENKNKNKIKNENVKKKEKDKVSNNEDIKKKKDSTCSKLTEKNSINENNENNKGKPRKNSKSLAALMKTNQVHSMLEQLLKSDTFPFQSKLSEAENEPLSLFSTTPKNTIVFATKIGPVFELQDKCMDILNWKSPSRSFCAYLIYSILCFKPFLILYIPIVSVVLLLAYICYKKETGKDVKTIKNDKEKISFSSSVSKKEKDKDLKTNLNDLFSSLSVKQKAAFNPNMVDIKTLQGNIQRLQNMMGSYCSAYDSVVDIWGKLNSTNPVEIRKALFFGILALIGQFITLKFVSIGTILFIAGTFAFFPHFSIFIVWVFTGWLKLALEKFNDIITRTHSNRSHTGKKSIKSSIINENSSDSESNDFATNSSQKRARLYSTIENNEMKVQKSEVNSSSSQKIMEGTIFTAIVVENQRWWIGTGFTDFLLSKDPPNYSTNYKDPKEALPSSLDNYPLPPNYRFLPNESWEIEMDHGGDEEGWIYMDNIWRNEGPQKITSYTRKRIWKRKAAFYS